MSRRLLGDMLAELAEGALAATAGTPIVISSLALTLPVEIAMQRTGGGWQVLGDLPRLLTRTAFDTAPSRLNVTWIRGERS